MPQSVRYRVGRSVGTTIYRSSPGQDSEWEPQPCAWVPGDPHLAAQIVELLNAAGLECQGCARRAEIIVEMLNTVGLECQGCAQRVEVNDEVVRGCDK